MTQQFYSYILPTGSESICPQGDVLKNVHSLIQSILTLNTARLSINRRVDKQNVAHLCNGMLPS